MAKTLANYIKPFIYFTPNGGTHTAVYDPVTESLVIGPEHVKLDGLITLSQEHCHVVFVFENKEEFSVTTESVIQAAGLLAWLQDFVKWYTCGVLSKLYLEFRTLSYESLLSHVLCLTYQTGEAVGFNAAYYMVVVQTCEGVSKYDISRQSSRLLFNEQCTTVVIKKTKKIVGKEEKLKNALKFREINVSFKR